MSTKYVITNVDNKPVVAEFDEEGLIGIEPQGKASIIGNIYIGRVENVVKNINCAFIEIAKGVKTFYSLDDNKEHFFLNHKNNNNVNQGDLLMVQVSTESFKTKPATVTSKISIPGKCVVLATDVKGVNISKKINHSSKLISVSESICEMLKTNNYNFGFIIRTNAANVDADIILNEAKALAECFDQIYKKALYGTAFTMCYKGASSYVTRISSTKIQDIDYVITDIDEIYQELSLSFDSLDVRLYKDDMLSLSSLYSLPTNIQKALNKKVWLKSGGYLVIEQAETLTAIDVNSGKAIDKNKKKGKQQQFLDINIEAAHELARQICIRNISGIIIVDFINLDDESLVESMIKALKDELKKDRIRTTYVDITKLGLVEITRKKTGKSLIENWGNLYE